MKQRFMKQSSFNSTAKVRSTKAKHAIVVLSAVVALAASAMAGAWSQAHFGSQPAASGDHQRLIGAQAARDSAFIRENVGMLASKLGDLQARLIALDGVSKRVAEAAGVSYTDPEISASLDQPAIGVMDFLTPEDTFESTAEGLGRQLDSLQRQLIAQQDGFTMLDLVLTRRVGVEARLPTAMPVNYPWLSSSFGWRRNPVTGRHAMHEGLDFAAPKGAPIHAASGGVVSLARYVSGYGNMVEIVHGNGLVTRYAHASSLAVKPGDLVEKGQLVAKVGSTGRSTGSHLHFEVRMAGHPLDPTLFLAQAKKPEQLVADASSASQAVTVQVR